MSSASYGLLRLRTLEIIQHELRQLCTPDAPAYELRQLKDALLTRFICSSPLREMVHFQSNPGIWAGFGGTGFGWRG